MRHCSRSQQSVIIDYVCSVAQQTTPELAHATSFFARIISPSLLDLPQVVGDDLLVTNPKRIEMAIEKKACSALLLKV
jgi:hypothetical protein